MTQQLPDFPFILSLFPDVTFPPSQSVVSSVPSYQLKLTLKNIYPFIIPWLNLFTCSNTDEEAGEMAHGKVLNLSLNSQPEDKKASMHL